MPASVARHSNAASLAIPSADSRAAVAHSVRTRLDFLSHSRKCCSMKRHASVLPCNGRRAGASNPASTQLDRLVHYSGVDSASMLQMMSIDWTNVVRFKRLGADATYSNKWVGACRAAVLGASDHAGARTATTAARA